MLIVGMNLLLGLGMTGCGPVASCSGIFAARPLTTRRAATRIIPAPTRRILTIFTEFASRREGYRRGRSTDLRWPLAAVSARANSSCSDFPPVIGPVEQCSRCDCRYDSTPIGSAVPGSAYRCVTFTDNRVHLGPGEGPFELSAGR